MGIAFAQRYKTGIDWDVYGTLFLGYKGKMIATAMKNGSPCQQSVALLEPLVANKKARNERKCFITNNTDTIPPYHVSIVLLKPVDHMVS